VFSFDLLGISLQIYFPTFFCIRLSQSLSYKCKMNGAIEVVNKNFKKIIYKMVIKYKDLHKILTYLLHT